MENILFSANIVLPLLCLMSVGYYCKYKKIIDNNSVNQCNNLVFKLFLPMLLFNNVRESSIEELGNTKLFIFIFFCIILSFVISTLIITKIDKDNFNRGVIIQGIARSNYALFGIPLISLLFPHDDIAVASILVAIVIPSFNVFSVILLSYFSNTSSNIKDIFISILKNPLIIATVLGIICLFYNIKFPYIIEKTISNLSIIATPFSLFLLGASFEFNSITKFKKQIFISVFGRLVVVPVMVLIVAMLLGFTDIELGCIMIIFSSPTAVSSFTMAKTMGANSDLASAIIVFTSMFCIFTIFLYIVIFKYLMLI